MAPITPWTPRARPSRRCEKKSSGWSRVQRSTRSTCSTPAAAQRALGRRPQVEAAVVRQIGVVALRDLRPDLVAARPDRRADHGRFRRRHRAQRRRPRRRPRRAHASRRADTRESRLTVGRGDGDRQAVGGHREQRQPGARRSRARRPARRARPGSARCTVGECTWRLKRERSYGTPIASQAIRRFSSTAHGLVAGAPAQVERVVRRLADAADARRERDDVPGLVPPDHRELLRPVEQVLARVPRRIADHVVEQLLQCPPDRRSRPVAERDQIVAARPRGRAAGAGSSAARRRPGGSVSSRSSSDCTRRLALPAQVGFLVVEQLERQPPPRSATSIRRARTGSLRAGSNMCARTIRTTRERSSFGYRSRDSACAARSALTCSWLRAEYPGLRVVVQPVVGPAPARPAACRDRGRAPRAVRRARRLASAAACTTANVCSSTVRSW